MNNVPMDETSGSDKSQTPPAEPSFACIRCWKLKKRCDKGSPQCQRCVTGGFDCEYSDEPPTGRLLRRAAGKGDGNTSQIARFPLQSAFVESSFFSTSNNGPPSPESDSAADISASGTDQKTVSRLVSAIYAPYHALKHQLPEILRVYFVTTNTWFPIISESKKSLFKIEDGVTPDPEMCTLLLAIYLVVKQTDARTKLDSLYSGLKRFHSNLQTISTQSIPIIQTGLLLAIYEQGQSLHQLSYLTIGAAVRIAQATGLHRTIEFDIETAGSDRLLLEEQRHMWWVLVIIERVLAFNAVDEVRPFASTSPKMTDYLPSFGSSTGEIDGGIEVGKATNIYSQFPDLHFPFTNPLGETVQATFLLAKTYEHINQVRLSSEQRNLEVEYLDKLLQAYMIRALSDKRREDGTKWHHSCGAFFMCMLTRLKLHMHNLKHTRHQRDQISQTSTQRSLIAIHMIARIGTQSKQTAQELGELDDEFLKEENMPPFTLCGSRDVALAAIDFLKSGQLESDVVGDEDFWSGAISFYKASFRLLGKKWRLAEEHLELVEKAESVG